MKTTLLLRVVTPFAFALSHLTATAGTPGGNPGATPAGNPAAGINEVFLAQPVITLDVSPDLGDLGYDWRATMKFQSPSETVFLRQSSAGGASISHAALRVWDGNGVLLDTLPINPEHEFHSLYLNTLPARDAYKVEMQPTHADGTPKWTPSNWVILTKAEPSGPIPFQFGNLNVEVYRDDYNVPGMSGAVSCGDQTVEFIAGVRRAGSPNSIQRGDLWHIGSDTKAMTATMIGMLVQQGLLDWNDTVWDLVWVRGLFPELRLPWSGIHPRFQNVTVEHLACHRSGMVMHGAEDAPTRQLANYMKDPTAFRRQTLKSLLTRDHIGIIGEWRYGHGNYMLLGSIIEQIKGKSYERVMIEDLFTPLGMTTADFGMPTDVALPANLAPNPMRWFYGPTSSTNPWVLNPGAALAVPTTAQPNGHQFPNETPTVDNLALPPVWNPAGGVYLSMADWMKFLRLHINGSELNAWLAPATLAKLHSPYNGPDRMIGPFDAPTDEQSNPDYGWGWGISNGDNGIVLGHGGSYGRFNAATQVYVDKGFAIATAANIDGGKLAYGDDAAWGLLSWMVGQALLGCDDGGNESNTTIGVEAGGGEDPGTIRPGRVTPRPNINPGIVLIPKRPQIGPAPVLTPRVQRDAALATKATKGRTAPSRGLKSLSR